MTISQDPALPLLVVVGATGLQGGSVVQNLSASSKPYRIRGLTRDVSKPRAKELQALGVEVVQCNLGADNVTGIEKAFQGGTNIFIVTNYWEHLDGDRELREGITMVDCAQKVGVKLLLISAVPSASKASDGKVTKAVHFDSKAKIVDHAKQVRVPFVEVHASGYYNNYLGIGKPLPAGDGSYFIQGIWSPDAKIPVIDTGHDFGLFVELALESEQYNDGSGGVVSAWCDFLSHAEIAEILSEGTGRDVTYKHVSEEEHRQALAYAGSPQVVIDDLIDMSKFHEFYWPKVFVHTDRSGLRRQPRSFAKYVESENWDSVFI